jgi:hypothetical protein
MFRKLIFTAAIILASTGLSATLSVARNWYKHPFAVEQLNGLRLHDPGVDSAEPIDGLSIARQSWRRDGGFLIAEMTVANKTQFPVDGTIVICDFFDPPDLFLGRRGSLISRILPPGETTIGGIEFTMLKHNILDRDILAGGCHLIGGFRHLMTEESYR